MRTFLLILMLALLPLRMWAADGMAVRMASAELASAAAASEPGAAMEHMDTSSMPEDCPMMAKADSGTGGSQDPTGEPGHAACLTCQLCAALAAHFEPGLARHTSPGARPLAGLDRFASAEPQRKLKPPIS